MNTPSKTLWTWAWIAFASLVFLGGCEDQKTPASSTDPTKPSPSLKIDPSTYLQPKQGTPAKTPSSQPSSKASQNPHNPHAGATSNPHNPHSGDHPHKHGADHPHGQAASNPHAPGAGWKPPTYVDPPTGKRAPSAELLGVKVGFTTLAEVEKLIADKKLTCEDRSPMAGIEKIIDKYMTEAKAKQARGEEVDMAKYEKYAAHYRTNTNPQIRLSCEKVSGTLIGDHKRDEAPGRWLFVFDDKKSPLRHTSFQRLYSEHDRAKKDFSETHKLLTQTFGEETKSSNELPKGEGKKVEFARNKLIRREWKFSDVHVKTKVMNFGARGVEVSESIEVPVPIRANAPADPNK